jgi:soluble lytic murein transglycosylase-like protein
VNARLAAMLAGLGALFVYFSRATLAAPGVALSRAQVEQLAQAVTSGYFPSVDPRMLVTIARIESSFNPLAVRYEPHLGDASVGLMQTLFSTASWLATQMGAGAFGVPTLADLTEPEKSMYYGAAFVSWLRTYGGRAQSEEWIVRAYNGGPGFTVAGTANYWTKYQAARADLWG